MGQPPTRMTRNALIACGLMQRHIFFGMTAEAIGRQVSRIATPDGWHVLVFVCALQWVVTCRMAVHAARMRQQLSDFAEDCLGTLGCVRKRHKFRRTFESLMRVRLIGVR